MCNNIDVEPRSYTLEASIIREGVIHGCYPFDRAQGSNYCCPCLGDQCGTSLSPECCAVSPACHNCDCSVLCCSPQRLVCVFGIFALCAPIVGTAGCLRNCCIGEPFQGLLECANGIKGLFCGYAQANLACLTIPINYEDRGNIKFIDNVKIKEKVYEDSILDTYFCRKGYICREENKLDDPYLQQKRWIDITFLRHDTLTQEWKKQSLLAHFNKKQEEIDWRIVNLLIKHGTLSESFFNETALAVHMEEVLKQYSPSFREQGDRESAHLAVMKLHLHYWPHFIDSLYPSASLAYQVVLGTECIQKYCKDLKNILNDKNVIGVKDLSKIVVDYLIYYNRQEVTEKKLTEGEVTAEEEVQFINSEELDRDRKGKFENDLLDDRTDVLTLYQPDNDQFQDDQSAGEHTYTFEGDTPADQHMN